MGLPSARRLPVLSLPKRESQLASLFTFSPNPRWRVASERKPRAIRIPEAKPLGERLKEQSKCEQRDAPSERSPAKPTLSDSVIDRNIAALINRKQLRRTEAGVQDRVADAITGFAGSMNFVYLHIAVYGAWIVINLGWIGFIPEFDSTFVVLAMVASVEAIFISTFVMISQNRLVKVADERADLDLQVSLLAEHEITRLLSLVTEIAKSLDLPGARNPEFEELLKDIAPEQVIDRIKETESRMGE
jgi:uncharacterized membrane protein